MLGQLIFIVLLILSTSCSRDVQDIKKAFELLTFPQKEWNEQDYGKEPDAELQALIRKNAPSFWSEPGTCGPMNFYQQFVPLLMVSQHGESHGIANRTILKKYERDFSVSYQLPSAPNCLQDPHPPLYTGKTKIKLPLTPTFHV
ncbi:MAG: hypothetical protein AB8G05_11215 [Oligoflexales bacterium]